MSGPPTPPDPTAAARSKLILTVGFSASAAILAGWLLVWLIFFRIDLRILALAGDPTDPTLPISLIFQSLDARDVAGQSESLPPSTDPDRLIVRVKAYLEGRRGQASIVYIASPALASFKPPGTVLAPPDVFHHVVKDEGVGGAALEKLIGAFKEAKGKRLLILDIGRSHADCDAGAFADDVVARLEGLIGPPVPGFAVLCSNAPGQWTWSSDVDGRSAFGHHVAEGLRGGGKVDLLLEDVPGQVSRWVRDQRGAVQTPIVLGDRSMRFSLPRRRPTVEDDDPRQGELGQGIRRDLADHYRRHAAYERGNLSGLDPIGWRDYRRAWLLAERLYRAGRVDEAWKMLGVADEKAAGFKAPGDRDWPSLELSLRVTTDPGRRDRLEKLRRSLGGPHPAGGDLAFEDYAETQPFHFAQIYGSALRAVRRKPDPGREPLIGRASKVRQLAEEAATTALGGHPRVDRLVDEGGALRREAGDLLFSEDNPSRVATLLDQAERGYRDAIEVARGVNLCQRVEADLPFLGAWMIRRGKPSEWNVLREIAEAARKLAHDLDDSHQGPGEIPIGRLHDEAVALKSVMDRLKDAFDLAAEAASKSRTWRLMDDALAVPSIDPALREKLVDRSIDPGNWVTLRPPAAPQKAGKESDLTGLARQSLGGVTVQDIGRRGLDAATRPSSEAKLNWAAPEIKPDPAFETHQAGLALLEGCLLTVGGLDDKEALQPLLHPTGTSEPFAKAARSARDRLLKRTPRPSKDDPATRSAFERAWLALPASDPGDRDDPMTNVAESRWVRLIVRLADILREDGDEKLAGAFLKGLGESQANSEEARRVALGIQALDQPIRLDLSPETPPPLTGSAPTPLTVTVRTPAGYPTGQYALLLGKGEDLRVDPADWTGKSETVEGSTTPRTIEVSRTTLVGGDETRPSIASVVYYRGRSLGGPTIPFDLPATRSDFVVRFGTRNLPDHRASVKSLGLDASRIRDQFDKHPKRYSLYRGASTEVDVHLKYTPVEGQPTRRRVVILATLDGKALAVGLARPKEPKAPPTRLLPSRQVGSGTLDLGDGREFTLVIPPIAADEIKEAGSAFRLEIESEEGVPLLRREFTVHSIDPEKYFDVKARLVQGELTIRVHRLDDDPVAFAVKVAAFTGQGRLLGIFSEKGSRPTGTDQAVLFHDDVVVFHFEVDPAVDHPCSARILNDRGPDWNLIVRPDLIKGRPVPPANPAGQVPPANGPGPVEPGP